MAVLREVVILACLSTVQATAMPRSIEDLVEIMAALRDPQTGCPWDVKQDFSTIAPYTIEEAYEVSDAIDRGDMAELREELGDLLLQVVFHAQMAREAGEFELGDVVAAICDKMVDRHPHVFDRRQPLADGELREAWENRKEDERRRKGGHHSALDGVARALPALLRAQKLVRRAARKGFDWPSTEEAAAKCREELDELQRAAVSGGGAGRVEEELGDLLFACAALACRHGVDAEKALRRANDKFERRFRRVEGDVALQGRGLEGVSVDEMLSLWERAKREAG